MYVLKYGFRLLLKIYYHFRNWKLKKHEPITLISNNCIAGFLYQNFNMQYYSPTIGLQFSQEDFVKFCTNFWHYIKFEIMESENKKQEVFTSLGGGEINFPVGKIDDIIIYFQHYKTFENAKLKWNERKLRISKKNLFFIFIVYNNTPIETIRAFESLSLKNKLIITNDENYISPISFALHNGATPWYDKMNNKLFSKKYYEQFDFNKWIINGIKNNGKRQNGT